MGSNYKSNGGKCGCSKRVKKAQRVPQRGPGVAELEKILSDQKQDHIKPMYTPNGPSIHNQPHYQPMISPPFPLTRTLSGSHFTPWKSDGIMRSDQVILSNDSGMSFTQMMMMGDPQDSKMNNFNLITDEPHAMTPVANLGCNHFNKHSLSQRFYSKCPQQLGHTNIENKRMVLRNILTLGPPSPTKGSSSLHLNPIFIDSDSSEEQCKDPKLEDSSDKSHRSQIFGFTLQEQKYLSMDETKLSLHHNVDQPEELSLDLTLKL